LFCHGKDRVKKKKAKQGESGSFLSRRPGVKKKEKKEGERGKTGWEKGGKGTQKGGGTLYEWPVRNMRGGNKSAGGEELASL